SPVDDRRVRIYGPDVIEGSAGDDTTSANEQPAVGVAPQRALFAKGVGGGVEERRSKQLRVGHRSAARSARTRPTATNTRSGGAHGKNPARGVGRAAEAPAPPRPESAHRLSNRLADRDGEHQRRFADRLAAENHGGLAGVAQETHTKIQRHFGPRRQLVRRGA